jgi:hypothetical protein
VISSFNLTTSFIISFKCYFGIQQGASRGRRIAFCAKVCTISKDVLLIANAKDIAEAFRGQAGRCPGPTMTLAVRPDSLQNNGHPAALPPAPPLASTLAFPPTIAMMVTCIKGGGRWRSGATFDCSGGSGGSGRGDGYASIMECLFYFSFVSIILVLCSNTICRVLRIYIVVHRVVFCSNTGMIFVKMLYERGRNYLLSQVAAKCKTINHGILYLIFY